MANYQQHLTQWKHNRSLLGSISTTYPDWIVTVAFYVALHATDSLLAHDGISRVHSHDTRNNVLMQTRRYEHIWRHYRPLHDLSRRIRYLAEPGIWVPADRIPHDILERYLYPLELSVQRLLNVSLSLPAIALGAG
jgi:hypothetical protein